jgi:microcystin-dependent protein
MTAPIGSIAAFAGPVYPPWENTSGWMKCDGRELDRTDPAYTPLFDAIGFSWGGDSVRLFRVPDLAGYFLRGVDDRKSGRDPDRYSRTAIAPGGQTGDNVGSVQGWGTALPERDHALRVEPAGRHHHTMSLEIDASRDVDGQNNTVAYPGPQHNTDTVGDHIHQLAGGHKETRPINAYVHWIIRFK